MDDTGSPLDKTLRPIEGSCSLEQSLHERPVVFLSWSWHSDTLLVTHGVIETQAFKQPHRKLFAPWGPVGFKSAKAFIFSPLVSLIIPVQKITAV